MSLSDNPFVDLPLADLQDLQAKYVQAIKDVATAGQTYTFPGRSFTRANLPDMRDTLNQINVAIRVVTGQGGHSIANAVIDTQSKFSG